MDDLTDIRATFFGECEEGLLALEEGLTALNGGAADGEVVHAVFRAVHSIKGGAGAFGLTGLVTFAHGFETLMDELRSGRLVADADLVAVLLAAADVLADLVAAARDGGTVDAARVASASAALKARLPGTAPTLAAATGTAPAAPAEDDFGFRPIPVAVPPPALLVTFRPYAALYARGNETGLIFRELARLGPLTTTLDANAVPALDVLDLDEPGLRWTLRLEAEEDAVRTAFEWVEGDCDLSIARGGAPPPPDAGPDIADLLARLVSEAAPPPAGGPAPLPLCPAVEPAPGESAPGEPAPAEAQARTAEPATIRVDLDRVDRLVDLVGELVIHGAGLSQYAAEAGTARGLEELERLTRDLQDSVMAIRAQPVRAVFQRMSRLVREIASRTGKRVRLVTEGEGTEVDRTVIERLGEPLTHMIRNAVDHGLETPEERLRTGKPAEGTLRLSASHRSGRILIEIADDGAGIRRARVRERAMQRGLITPDAALSDEEVDNLIFLPGFSTAEAVSDISGRGVGMDVVKRSVASLGGRIAIASQPGEGSTFTLSLPLTLAVLDGMVIEAGGQTLVLPLSAILETLRPKPADLRVLGGTALLVNRGAFVPIVDIGQTLGFSDRPLDPSEGIVLLVESEGGRYAALLADRIHGGRQVVIKSLEANYQAVPGISAATILGDGRVALILDTDALAAGSSLSQPLTQDGPRRLALVET